MEVDAHEFCLPRKTKLGAAAREMVAPAGSGRLPRIAGARRTSTNCCGAGPEVAAEAVLSRRSARCAGPNCCGGFLIRITWPALCDAASPVP